MRTTNRLLKHLKQETEEQFPCVASHSRAGGNPIESMTYWMPALEPVEEVAFFGNFFSSPPNGWGLVLPLSSHLLGGLPGSLCNRLYKQYEIQMDRWDFSTLPFAGMTNLAGSKDDKALSQQPVKAVL
ncbi:MAG: hypothetical protein DRP45_06280 [Candidatus Zixiibacteriota bacterium]|nr:MAG: hypothetical protein DRP45_06280 [candidate division Zixibacteria bacterium]